MGYHHFTKEKRMELSILRKKGYSLRDIGNVLGVNASSVSRELRKNKLARSGEYDPEKADHKAYVRRKNSKYEGMKICRDEELEAYVKEKLKKGWTPEEISGRLERERGEPVISFKVIYKWIYSSQGQAYAKFLPTKRHRKRKRWKKKRSREMIPNRVSIDFRPKVIEKRKRIGDFEGDTLGRKKGTSEVLSGLVDRRSRYLLARKVPSLKHTMDTFQALLKNCVTKSLTLDNGVENKTHQKLGIPTYFCDPYSSWQKGSIENTFQRLRRHVPKGSDLKSFSHKFIASVVDRMNNTPRKCLGYQTPAEVFKDHLF